jgi:hypothetical protein
MIMVMINMFRKLWKEALKVWLKSLSRNLPLGTE